MPRVDESPVARRKRELRRYQQGAFVLAASALIVGGALVPRGDELLLIHVKNRQISSARALLADAAGQQVSSVAAVVAHNELYLLEGRVDDALRELEAYVAKHPSDPGAWRRMTQMYAHAQRFEDQVRAMRHLHAIEPSPDNARRLVTLLRWAGDEPGEAEALGGLVAAGDATADEHVRYARLEAAFDRPGAAFEALERLRRREPGAFDLPTTELYASVLLQTRGPSNLAGPLQVLPIVRSEPEALRQLARTFTAWGHPDAAVALFDTPSGVDPPADRLVMRALAARDTAAAPDVLRELAARDVERPLPPSAFQAFVDLALASGDYDVAVARLAAPERAADPDLTGRLLSHLLAHRPRSQAQAIIARLGDESLRDSPMLALDLAVARGDVAAAERWIRQMDADGSATPGQVAAVAQFEARLGREAQAFERLAGLFADGSAPEWAATDFAGLADRLGRVDEALPVLAASPSPGARGAWARLAVGAGRGDEAQAWLASADARALDVASLRDIYFLARERRQLGLAMLAAERLFRLQRSAEHALLVGQVLLAAGRPEAALDPLRQAAPASPEAQLAYESALVAALHGGSNVAGEIRSAFPARLALALPVEERELLVEGLWAAGERASLLEEIVPRASQDLDRWLSPLVEAARAAGRPDRAVAVIADAMESADAAIDERRVDRVRALMDLDAPDDVLLPHLRGLAEGVGDTWVFAYDERLARAGRVEEREAFWRRRADPVGPTAVEVQQLLAVWGAAPPESARPWLAARLRTAPPADRSLWMRYLLQTGVAGARLIVSDWATLPEQAGDEFLNLWVDAHQQAAHPDELRAAWAQLAASPAAGSEVIRRAGRVALSAELPDVAARAFESVAARLPGDPESLRWLGGLAFYSGRHDDARAHLEAYVEGGGAEPEALYQLGELAAAARDRARARELYDRALAGLEDPARASSQQALLANVLVRTDRRARAAETFARALDTDPAQDHVRADFVAALLSWGDYARADAVLRGRPTDARDGSGSRRLGLLRVQWLTHEGRYGDALRELEDLSARFPGDPDVLVARAAFDADRGRPASADQGYLAARRQAPDREDIQRVVRQRGRQRSPRATLETQSRTISGGWEEQTERVAVQGSLRPYVPATFTVDRLRLAAAQVRRADGTVTPARVDRRRFEAGLAVPAGLSWTLGGTLFGSGTSAGAAATAARTDLHGRVELSAEANRPFWDVLESAVDDGRRDRVMAVRHWRVRPDTAAWLQAAATRYRLASGASARTAALTFGLVRTVRQSAPSIAVQYGFDKEHRVDATIVALSDGQRIMPLPLASREVHVAGAIARFDLRRTWEVETAGGYTADRLGGRGAFLTARMTPKPEARAGVALWAERRLYTLSTAQVVLSGGAQLVVRVAP